MNLSDLYMFFRNHKYHNIADAILDDEIQYAAELARSAGYDIEAQYLEDIDDAR